MTVPEVMRAVVLGGHGGLHKLEYRQDHPLPRAQEYFLERSHIGPVVIDMEL